MAHAGMRPGISRLTTEACTDYYDKGKQIPDEIREQIFSALAGLEEKAFYEVNLISGKEEIRSGAALMYAGLRIPRMTGDFRSLLCHICRK